MGYADLNFQATDENRALRDMAMRFATEVMRPAGIALDRYGDPAHAIAKGCELWPVMRQFRELGLHRAYLPAAMGGMSEEVGPIGHHLLGEALGYGDAGLAISLEVSAMPFLLAGLAPTETLTKLCHEFCNDTSGEMVGCWAITEPDHGTDWFLGKDDPRCGPQVKGVLKGDTYILNGEKAAWVSNGTIASHASVHFGVDSAQGIMGSAIAVCPLDLPGISRGLPLDKMGQRPLNQGSIIFEDTPLPADYVVLPPGTNAVVMEPLVATVNGAMSNTFAGLCRAIFDETLKYCQERVQGGVPISEHKNVKVNLFRMFQLMEQARCVAYRQHMYNGQEDPLIPKSAPHAVVGKCTSTENATQMAGLAIMLHGGNGLSKEYTIEKLYRDARTSMVEDGVNESLGIAAMEMILGTYFPEGAVPQP